MHEESRELIADCIGLLFNDSSIPSVMNKIEKQIKSIPDMLFYKKFKVVMMGLDSKGIKASQIREILSQSSYNSKYAEALIQYIVDFETSVKAEYMVNLIDSVCHIYISPDECMWFCWCVNTIPLPVLNFLKDNVLKKTLYDSDDLYSSFILELKNHGFVYDSENNGNSFTKEAFLFDKYCLSYMEENRYVDYSERMSGLPSSFPNRPIHLIV